MSKGFRDLDLYNAPQWIELGVEESSNIDNFFNSGLELRSTMDICATTNSLSGVASPIVESTTAPFVDASDTLGYVGRRCSTEIKAEGIQKNEHLDTPRNAVTHTLKNAYRAPIVRTPPSSTCSNLTGSPVCHESPELGSARPWPNNIRDSLVNAMSMLRIKSSNNHHRNVLLPMTTSTPYVSVQERSTNLSAEDRTEDPQNLNRQEIPRTKYSDENLGEVVPSDDDIPKLSGSSAPGSSLNEHPSQFTEFPVHIVDPVTKKITEICAKKKRSSTKPPRVPTSQVRRQSLKYRRRSGKFVSMAEAILKFERSTPKRFRTRSNKTAKAGPPRQDSGQTSRCESRNRPATDDDRGHERDAPEIDETRGNRVKPNVRVPNKNVEPSTSSKKLHSKTNENTKVTSATTRKRRSQLRTVTKLVSTEQGPEFRQVEIIHFGIPALGTTRKLTQTVPFDLTARRANNVKAARDSKNNEIANRPSDGKMVTRDDPTTSTAGTTRPKFEPKSGIDKLTFEERNKLLLKKRNDLAKATIEQEKRARIFRARPAPNFKPVQVLGTSTGNIKLDHDRTQATSTAPRTMVPSTCDAADRENRSPNLPNPSPRATDKRFIKRSEFDGRMEINVEENERRSETSKDQKLNTEFAKTPDATSHPMAAYKSPKRVRSTKPLTVPRSPAWSRRTKKK